MILTLIFRLCKNEHCCNLCLCGLKALHLKFAFIGFIYNEQRHTNNNFVESRCVLNFISSRVCLFFFIGDVYKHNIFLHV